MSNRRHSVIKAILLVTTLLLILTLGCSGWVVSQTKNYIFENIDDIPHNRVGLLLSTEYYYNDSEPNVLFDNCIKATADLYHSGRITHILIGGAHSGMDGESMKMKDALITQNISESAITVEYNSRDLLALLQYMHHSYRLDSLTVIADPSSIHRLVFISHQSGITAVAYCSQDIPWRYAWRYKLHELFANVRTVTDACFF